MKILLVHNEYRIRGGEEEVVARERDLLRARGNIVGLVSVTNDAIAGLGRVPTALRTHYSRHSRRMLAQCIGQCLPDVVHVHNFFPLLSPSIYDACRAAEVPVVQTLHNYRLICPGAFLMRDGHICEECLHRGLWRSLRHRCYRDSLAATLPVAAMLMIHRWRETWSTRVDRFIALTEFARLKFIQGGLPAARIVVKPNFTEETPLQEERVYEGSPALFVGRMSPEKGLCTLLATWEGLPLRLRLAGDGPLSGYVTEASRCNPQVEYLGRLPREAVNREMLAAGFLVMPSEWYEGFGLVVIEAFSLGLPVVVSSLGALAEIVEDGVTGVHFEPGNPRDLRDKVMWLAGHPEECARMGGNARRVHAARFSAEENYRRLMEIYQDLLRERAGRWQ